MIKRYLEDDKCFCFSCGNAVEALQREHVRVIPVSHEHKLRATKYITPLEAKFYFNCFDATSGNLPIFLMEEISQKIKEKLPNKMFEDNKKIYIPVGSGETYLAFSYLFKINRLIPFKSSYPPIKFEMSPLIKLINIQIEVRDFKDLTINQIWDKLKQKKGYFIYTENEKTKN